jgi:hypothetical protein
MPLNEKPRQMVQVKEGIGEILSVYERIHSERKTDQVQEDDG